MTFALCREIVRIATKRIYAIFRLQQMPKSRAGFGRTIKGAQDQGQLTETEEGDMVVAGMNRTATHDNHDQTGVGFPLAPSGHKRDSDVRDSFN
jgi:hypothetical protein